jgi:hypothetical protein
MLYVFDVDGEDRVVDTSFAEMEKVAKGLVDALRPLKYGKTQEVKVTVYQARFIDERIVSGHYMNSYKFLRKT